MPNDITARAEWARHWKVPLVGMLGVTGSAAYSYSSGVFMVAMTEEFGWSRAQFSSALTVQMLAGLLIVPFAGRVLDWLGPRRMALTGIAPFVLIFSAMGLANGNITQWWLLTGLLSLGNAAVMTTLWVAGTTRTFDASRGLAMGVTLAGMGLATGLWPVLAARYIEWLGWRMAFPAMALTWAAVLLPLTVLFFKPRDLPAPAMGSAPGAVPPLGPALRSRAFVCILVAGSLFAFCQLSLIVHLVAILRGKGIDMQTAAGVAGLTGVFSVLGRLTTGWLLDFLPLRPLAVGAFSLMLGVVALLGFGDGSLPMLMAGAALLGFSAGSEMDVVTYIASRQFDQRLFGSVHATVQTGYAICSSLGPLAAGRIFDVYGSYDRHFMLVVPVVLVATLVIALAPRASAGAR